MESLTNITISEHNRYSYNYQNNVHHIELNLDKCKFKN